MRAPLDQYLESFHRRVVHDAIAEATQLYWIRRAKALESALPRPGDYLGSASPLQRAERRRRLRESIAACYAAARVAPLGHDEAVDHGEPIGGRDVA